MGEKECSQDQVFNENSVPKAAKWGNLNTKSVTIFRVFAQDGKKSWQFWVTLSWWQLHKMIQNANGSNMHTWLKLEVCFTPK